MVDAFRDAANVCFRVRNERTAEPSLQSVPGRSHGDQITAGALIEMSGTMRVELRG